MILITGGACYIGSHVNKLLNRNGYETLVFDNAKLLKKKINVDTSKIQFYKDWFSYK